MKSKILDEHIIIPKNEYLIQAQINKRIRNNWVKILELKKAKIKSEHNAYLVKIKAKYCIGEDEIQINLRRHQQSGAGNILGGVAHIYEEIIITKKLKQQPINFSLKSLIIWSNIKRLLKDKKTRLRFKKVYREIKEIEALLDFVEGIEKKIT